MKKILLTIACLLITIGLYDKYNHHNKIDIIPDNAPVIPLPPIPPKPTPILETNIIHDNLELAKKLCIEHNRQLLIIFGADWCPHCKKLKNDISKLNTSKLILCIINIDEHKDLGSKYKIKILPTAILCDRSFNEESRKTGYNYQEYKIWLDSN